MLHVYINNITFYNYIYVYSVFRDVKFLTLTQKGFLDLKKRFYLPVQTKKLLIASGVDDSKKHSLFH